MSPLLDSIGSAKGYGWGAFLQIPAFESIASFTGTGSTNTATFSSIPPIYKHLQIRGSVRSVTAASVLYDLKIVFNEDTTTTYSHHNVYGSISSASVQVASSTSSAIVYGSIPGENITPSVYGAFIIDIYDYLDTSKNKTIKTLGGTSTTQTPNISGVGSGFWRNTAAINSITLTASNSSNFASGSIISLYGIRG